MSVYAWRNVLKIHTYTFTQIYQHIKKIKIDDFIYEIPGFLISRTVTEEISKVLIKKSLYFIRNVIQNKFFIPNNLKFPRSRILLENYFN